MTSIKVQNVTKRFGDRLAVVDVSFEVRDRELVCLLGPSGAGKSTLLRIIAGLDSPDSGTVSIDGEMANHIPPKDRDLAMMFQSYALYPNRTVYENLAIPLRNRKVPVAEVRRKVTDVAQTLGLSNLLERFPNQLSGGERQRVAMGRAIIRKPKAFLLDEPLTNLDAKLRVSMRAELKRLQRELGATTIFATPDQLEALTISDRIVVMNQGKILQDGTPETIYEHPNGTFTASFVGTPAINLVECSLEEKDGKSYLNVEDFAVEVTELASQIPETSSDFILGIRPEHISLTQNRISPHSISAEIYVSERARPEQTVHFRIGKTMMQAIAPIEHQFAPSEKVWATFDQRRIHLFDKSTQKAIT